MCMHLCATRFNYSKLVWRACCLLLSGRWQAWDDVLLWVLFLIAATLPFKLRCKAPRKTIKAGCVEFVAFYGMVGDRLETMFYSPFELRIRSNKTKPRDIIRTKTCSLQLQKMIYCMETGFEDDAIRTHSEIHAAQRKIMSRITGTEVNHLEERINSL